MKATITFTLPEENAEYRMHCRAGTMASLIYDFTTELRNKSKYGEPQDVTWDAVYDLWLATLEENNYDPYDE